MFLRVSMDVHGHGPVLCRMLVPMQEVSEVALRALDSAQSWAQMSLVAAMIGALCISKSFSTTLAHFGAAHIPGGSGPAYLTETTFQHIDCTTWYSKTIWRAITFYSMVIC